MYIYKHLYSYFLTPQEGGRKWKIKSWLICKLGTLVRAIFCKDIGRSTEGLEILCEYCRNAFGWSTENWQLPHQNKSSYLPHRHKAGWSALLFTTGFYSWALLTWALLLDQEEDLRWSFLSFCIKFTSHKWVSVLMAELCYLFVLWILSFYKPLPRYLHSNGSITTLSTCSELSILLIYY